MATPFSPEKNSQEAIIAFMREAYSMLGKNWNVRQQMFYRDLAYMREGDMTNEQYKAKLAQTLGDPTKFQNIVVPVVMPQVEAALTYQQSVFLTGYPIFGVVSRPGFENAALQMDTIIGDQQVAANWVPNLLKVIRDGFKYNLGMAEVEWCRKVTYTLETAVEYKAGQEGRPKELIWEGNAINHIDMYNAIWDTRVLPCNLPEQGEFAGYTKLYSRIALKKLIEELPLKINVKEAFESGIGAVSVSGVSAGNSDVSGRSYYIPNLNPDMVNSLDFQATTNWAAWAGLIDKPKGKEIEYNNLYEVTTLYARILPSEFGFKGVPGPNTPQVWKLMIVNGKVVIYCERMTNAHNLLPIIPCVPLDDGLGLQTKPFAKNVEPFQQITTALANSGISARRRAISDRALYDPSRISESAINNEASNAKIPVKPSAFQTPLSEAVYAFPFQDNQFQINMAESQYYMALANNASGLNPARQGQFVKGNKTRSEFDSIMMNANGRDQSVALMLEGGFFTPIKHIIKTNILQYQGNKDYYNPETQEVVNVDPTVLRKANLIFKISDGLMPSDKLIDADSWGVALQAIGSSPQISSAYNMGPMFSYLMKMKGAKLTEFEKSQEQIAYEQAVAQWQSVCAGIVEMLKSKEGVEMKQIQQAFPPQPKPVDYGFDPKTVTAYKKPNTILSQVSQQV